MRYLAIDLGDKRTGLAVGDDVTGIASPVDVIEAATDDDRVSAMVLDLSSLNRAGLPALQELGKAVAGVTCCSVIIAS